MSSLELLQRFIVKAPFAVMTRLLMHAVMVEDLDRVFDEHRENQYEGVAKFSCVALAVADVVLRFSNNFNQAYKVHQEQL
ncbi:MAG: hypothetical protein KDA60_10650, partial [Planctomycetales bacterium]|nr:hypothetical protein [Planctomycetales bacterium]